MKEWEKCKKCKCPSCNSIRVMHKEDEHGDFEHKCDKCGCHWWVDGPDY